MTAPDTPWATLTAEPDAKYLFSDPLAMASIDPIPALVATQQQQKQQWSNSNVKRYIEIYIERGM
jgi:hypothetical protein